MTDQQLLTNQFMDSQVRYNSVGDSRQRSGTGCYVV